MNGFLIAAPSSGAGKTTITLGLLRALKRKGVSLAPVKVGPDYVDAALHKAASGVDCFNLDPWAMRHEFISALSSRITEGGKVLLAEGMMGLFDGALDGAGSSAELARLLDLPVVLVVDCAKQSQSVAALVSGFSQFNKNVLISGLILNQVGSARHEVMLRNALEPLGISILGCIYRDEKLNLPDHHLVMAQSNTFEQLEGFLDYAADIMEKQIDFTLLEHLWSGPKWHDVMANVPRLKPLGDRIAIARDAAFRFCYAHILEGWSRRGAEISFFSPLADEGPAPDADAIYLPGGYPELYADVLAHSSYFRQSMKAAASRGVRIYGEGGGYIVLGDILEDADGAHHSMLGLLPLETSFAKRKLHMGYRILEPLPASPWQVQLKAHEFHNANIVRAGDAERLFCVRDALNEDRGEAGLRVGSVCGSFMHILDFVGD